MTTPAVSVAMVVCNVDRFLAESIESILSQTFPNFELIIVDFGSTDNSRLIASTYAAADSRVKLHDVTVDSLAEARNAACFLANAQFIAIMDADDIADASRLALQVDFMTRHPEVGFLGGATEWIDSKGRSLRIDHLPTEDHEIRAALTECCPFCQASILMRKEAFCLVRGYREVFSQAEDYDLWLRLVEHYRCANLTEVVLKYRIHPYQLTTRRRTEQTLCVLAARVSARARSNGGPDPLNVVDEITSELLIEWGVSRTRQQRAFANDYRHWIGNMSMAGEYSTALKAAREFLQSDLENIEGWQIADLHLIVGGLLWRERQFADSMLSILRALMARPLVAGRPLKSLLRTLRRV